MKKMVYTITFHRANNYGAMLQAYALQKKISEKFETQILDYDNKYISNIYRLFRGNDTFILRDIYHFIKNVSSYKKDKYRYNNFLQFRNQLKLSKYFKNSEEVNNNFKNVDSVYVVGSDQVWNTNISHGFDEVYTLGFASNESIKIAYAASSGKVNVLKDNENKFKDSLNRLNSISVREKPMCDYLVDTLDKDVTVTLDPSLLLTKEQWEDFSGEDRIIEEKYIFAYSVGNANESYYETLNDLAKLTGYKIVFFDKKDNNIKFKKESRYTSGPIEFVNLLKYSEYVVTTSFHGTALSIILNKNFFPVLSSLPDRLLTLLRKMNLDNRIIKNKNDFMNIFYKEIDWCSVNTILNEERIKSERWLFNAIRGDKK